MIDQSNYNTIIYEFGIENLDPALKAQHDNYLSIQEFYHDDDEIRQTIDLYFSKLEKFINKFKQADTEKIDKEQPNKSGTREKATRHAEPKPKRTNTRTRDKRPLRKGTRTKQKASNTKKVKVEHLREEIKFIRRYVGLHHKVKPPSSLLTFIKSLQRAIVQKLIRKTSPYASEIRMIQNRLIAVYNNAKGDLKFTINEKDLNRLVAIAGGEEVYPSINIIKRYIGLQGKELDNRRLELFNKQITNALDKKRIQADDPYYDKVKAIHNTLKKLRADTIVQIGKAELNGLEGIVKACGCGKGLGKIYNTGGRKLRSCKKRTYTDSINRGACSHNKGLGGVLTAEEMATRQLDLLGFFSVWLALFGSPAKNFTMMIHGEPHGGKTILLLKFAQFLAENFGDVLYVSSEEFASPTMTNKVNEFLTPFPDRLHFSENLAEPDLSDYDFIILDSVNDLGLKVNDYKAIRQDHPDTAFILILQHTKDGQFKGGKDWEHIAEIVGEVERGSIHITKNRYAPKNSLDFFEYFGVGWEKS